MNNTQFLITIALAPVMSLVIVLAGYVVPSQGEPLDGCGICRSSDFTAFDASRPR